MTKAAISWLKQRFPPARRTRLIAGCIPASLWFRCALVSSRLHGRLADAAGRNGKLTELLMRDHWLHELTSQGPFDIPWRLHGRKALDKYLSGGPVLYFALHLAMSDMLLRVVQDLGYPVPVPVASQGRTVEGELYPVIGTRALIPALTAGPYTLTRMRTLFQNGTSIACLADQNYLEPELNSNPMRLAGRMRVPVIFAFGEVGEDGVIDVTFEELPHPYCETEAAIEENLDVLAQRRNSILRALGMAPPMPERSRSTILVLTPSSDVRADSHAA